LFVEARFAFDDNGEWAAIERMYGAVGWRRYRRAGVALRLVARAQRRTVPGVSPLDGTATVGPLPYYVGVRALVPALPRLVVAIVREVLRAEVIVLRLPGMIGLLASVVCRVLRRRYSVELEGDPLAVLESGAVGRLGRVLAPLVGRQMRRAVRHACAASYVTESTLQRRYPHGRDAVAVSVSDVRPSFVDAGRRWRPGPICLVTVGSQEVPYKGHDVLVRAIQRLRADEVALSAVIVGGGRLHHKLVDLAAQLEVDDVVTFTGPVNDHERLFELLDSASLFVLPSLTEGMPRALIEAMARGLPAVGSDVGGIPELLDKRFLVPPGDPHALADAIAILAGNRAEWEAQSRRNLRTARRFRSDVHDARFAHWLGNLPSASAGADR
jgi:glycosyltransferase involved in cell wall biosynthesis